MDAFIESFGTGVLSENMRPRHLRLGGFYKGYKWRWIGVNFVANGSCDSDEKKAKSSKMLKGTKRRARGKFEGLPKLEAHSVGTVRNVSNVNNVSNWSAWL